MLAPPLISILTAGGFGLRLDGERLIVHPASDLTDDLRTMIREHKLALVRYLRQMQDPANDAAETALVSCDDCRHYRPDPVGHGGLGRCLTEAKESQRPGSLWPGSRLFCASFVGQRP